jgi:glutathione S-transferase
MTIKVYGMAYSTCVARVLATLAEKEVEDYELVPVDVTAGAHKKPEFLKMQVLVPSSGQFAISICVFEC